MAYDEVIKRKRKAHHKSRDYSGEYARKFNLEECLCGRTTKVKRRLHKMLIHLLEFRKNRKNNIGQVERGVRQKHSPHAKRIAVTKKCRNANKKEHHRYTGNDIGVHHGYIGNALHSGLINLTL